MLYCRRRYWQIVALSAQRTAAENLSASIRANSSLMEHTSIQSVSQHQDLKSGAFCGLTRPRLLPEIQLIAAAKAHDS